MTLNVQMTDLELAHACIEGRKDTQKKVYAQHARLMMSICLRYARNRQEAEDIFQDGFIKAFERMNQYSGSGPLGGWIRMIMVNTAINHIRANQKWKHTEDIEAAEKLDGEDVGALENMSAGELMDLVQRMPTGYKTVFNLFAIEGFAHKEIAEQLGVTENTSKTQFFKARRWLKKQLETISRTA
ncbi:MAG: sigma-70 family RNA polymerase sigma factor [Flavobacteriales bacterium]|nr:sigma-70 family RNA polymerase sigma factor [Flavobacteriales bacterium]